MPFSPQSARPAAPREVVSTPASPLRPAALQSAALQSAALQSAAAPWRTPPVAGAPVITLADYPLAPGATWYYRTYDAIDTGEHGVAEERGSLTVRTLAVHRLGDLTVATQETRRVVNAETSTDISWQVVDSGDVPPRSAAGAPPARVHLVTEPGRLRQVLDTGSAALRGSDADLAFPLQVGALWGDERLLARGDGLYVNRVEEPRELDLPAGRLKAWPIVFATLPERMTTWFAPGVGVVRYEYSHNGSLSRESYELLEFRRGAADTLALVRCLDTIVRRSTDDPDFWALRASLAEDAELRALLGPLTVAASGELPDGTRRHVLEGDGTTLTFAQLPEGHAGGASGAGAPRATVVEWRNRAGLIHTFGAADARPPHPAPRGS